MLSTVTLKHLKNLSHQHFLEQNPWSVKTQLENILLNEDTAVNEPQLAVALLLEGVCLVAGF